MTHEWKNKVVFITGAATGIGAKVVRLLMEEGVKHVGILDVAEEAGINFQNELNAKYGAEKVKFIKGDVTDDEQLLGALKTTYDDNNYVDVVINNAGILNDKVFKKEIAINLSAVVTGTLKAIELMRKDQGGKGGTVINISSIAGLSQSPVMPVYWATKTAVLQFSNCIGMEPWYSRTGVRVLTVCFGATDTPLLSGENMKSFDEEFETEIQKQLIDFPVQRPESAAQGLVDTYKKGESGTAWIATHDRPVIEITETIKKAYELMSVHVFS